MATRDRLTAYQLYGVAPADGHGVRATGVAAQVITFRDLSAVVAPVAYSRPPANEDALGTHRRVVDELFARGTVIPAPAGVVFRSRDMLTRWLELHYITLSDALVFLDGRAVTRIHVSHARHETSEPAAEAGAAGQEDPELATLAGESFRVLRRHAVAMLALKPEPAPEEPDTAVQEVVASFLLDRDRWTLFSDIVREEAKRAAQLVYRQTGPWPPYDFVSMQFGA